MFEGFCKENPLEPSGDQMEPSGDQMEPRGDQMEPSGDQMGASRDQMEPSGVQMEPSGDRKQELWIYFNVLMKAWRLLGDEVGADWE